MRIGPLAAVLIFLTLCVSGVGGMEPKILGGHYAVSQTQTYQSHQQVTQVQTSVQMNQVCGGLDCGQSLPATHETASGRILYWIFTESCGFPDYPTDPSLENDLRQHAIGTRAELEEYGNAIQDPRAIASWNGGSSVSVVADGFGNLIIKVASMGTPEVVPGTIESLIKTPEHPEGQPVAIVYQTVYVISPDGVGQWKGDARYRIEAGTDVPKFVSKVLPNADGSRPA